MGSLCAKHFFFHFNIGVLDPIDYIGGILVVEKCLIRDGFEDEKVIFRVLPCLNTFKQPRKAKTESVLIPLLSPISIV